MAQKEKLLHSTFTQFDKSNTGFINKGDLANVLDEMDLHPTAKDVDILMDILDDDHSGQISYSEFRDHFILLNPVDFSKLADEWMHHSGDAVIGGISNKPADGFHKAASGGISAAISRSVVAPLERLRMQMSVDGAKYNNSNVQALKGETAYKERSDEDASSFWQRECAARAPRQHCGASLHRLARLPPHYY